MRVLCLPTDGYGGHGGIALHCRHLIRALASDSRVASLTAIPRVAPLFDEPVPENVAYLGSAGRSSGSYLRAVLARGLLARRWNAVVTEHIHLLPLAAAIAAPHRARLGLIIHGLEAWQPPGRHATSLLNAALKRLHVVVAVSRVTRGRFLEWTGIDPNKVVVVPNALEPGNLGPGPKPVSLLSRYGIQDEPVILTMGRLSSSEGAKGFEKVIRVLPALARERPDLRYLVVGDGEDRARLEALARDLGVAGRVIFSGRIPEVEKADHFRLADAYVMPGRLEGFGYVFLEAMACGLPVVGGAGDGSREPLLDGELGPLVDPEDSVALKRTILQALDQPRVVPPELARFSLERFAPVIRDAILGRDER